MKYNGLVRSLLVLSLVLVASETFAQYKQKTGSKSATQAMAFENADVTPAFAKISKEIRHELVTLPYYGVFDWLEYEVQPEGTIVLRGQVVRPTTKSDAEGRVSRIDGVTRVANRIEVLPLSPNDDRLRVALYRTIYGFNSPLFRYATQAVPSIHLIVKNGRATLKGVAATKGDAQLAYIKARGVPGLFEVNSEILLENGKPR